MTTAFETATQLPGAETHVMYDMKVAVRPTDGKAFIIGSSTNHVWFGRLGGAPVRDISGGAGQNTAQWPSLAFGNDGTGYAVWRSANSWRAWLQPIPAGWDGGDLPPGHDLSGPMGAGVGALNVTQLDIAYSRVANKLYAVGFFDFGTYATTGFMESTNGGNTWGGYRELKRDDTRSNQSPQLHVSRVNDNVHVLFRNGSDGLYASSRINGTWDAQASVLASSGTIQGWDVRSIDGHNSKGVVETKDGTVVAVWRSRPSNSFGMSRRVPGGAWSKVSDAVVPNSATMTVSIDITPNDQVYILMQGDQQPYSGAVLLPVNLSTDPATWQRLSLKSEPIWGNAGNSMDLSAYGGRLWFGWSIKGGGPETAYFTSAAYDGTIPVAPIVTTPPPVVVVPPPVVTEFLPPSSVSVNAPSFNQVYIYWKDKTSDEVEFSVERKEKDIPYRIVGSAAANANQWLDVIGIEPETKYTYRVRAHKTGLYSNYSMEVSVVTPAVPVPEPVVVPPAPAPVPVDPNVVVKNGFNLGHGMLDYWKKFDTMGVPHPLGLPKSNEFDWVSASGKKYVVQVFERAVLGYDASEPDVRYRVQPLIIGPEWLAAHKK